jgi:hypothetical protein
MFATDCGTLYAPYCLQELILHMESNPSAAAVTGHQRIMAKEDQLDPWDQEPEPWSGGVLRSIQAFDFESGLCVFNGMHALAGFLPVVPGPCGLFRTSAVTPQILARVRSICGSKPSDDDLVIANLKIAEDRILSYLLVLVERKGGIGHRSRWQTHWVPSTTFFFESESTLREFVLQRRRWLNGTVAGYLWLLRTPELWNGVCSGSLTAFNVLVLSSVQLLVFFVVYLMPGMLVVTGYLSYSGLGLLAKLMGSSDQGALFSYIAQLYAAIAMASLASHVYFARFGASNFTPWIWNIRVVLNSVTMGVTLLATLVVLSFAAFKPIELQNALSTGVDGVNAANDVDDSRVAGCLGILYTTTPFFLSMMHSNESFKMMLSTYRYYYFFGPTILADFFAYSLARYDDITWGTKAVSSSGKSGVGELATKKAESSRRRYLEVSSSSQAFNSSSRRQALTKQLRESTAIEENQYTTTLISFTQLALCLIVLVVNFQLRGVAHYLLYFGLSVSIIGYIIMTASFSYFLGRAVCGCGGARPTVCQRFNALFIFLGWLTILGSVFLISVPSMGLQVEGGYAFIFTYLILICASIPHCISSPKRNFATQL